MVVDYALRGPELYVAPSQTSTLLSWKYIRTDAVSHELINFLCFIYHNRCIFRPNVVEYYLSTVGHEILGYPISPSVDRHLIQAYLPSSSK